MKTQIVILWILFLIIIDQVIKIIINTYFGNSHFEIVSSLIEFKPTFNNKHSFANVLINRHLEGNIGLLPHLILFLLIGIIISSHFFYFRNKIQKDTKIIDSSIVFLFAGIICALIGNLIWDNGTLDYIYLKPLFVFDLKDTYGSIGVVLFFIYVAKNFKEIKQIKSKEIYQHIKRKMLSTKSE